MFFSPSYHLLSCRRLQKQCLDKMIGQREFLTYLLEREPLQIGTHLEIISQRARLTTIQRFFYFDNN